MSGSVFEAGNLFVLRCQVRNRVEDQIYEREVALHEGHGHVALDCLDASRFGLRSQHFEHVCGQLDPGYRNASGCQADGNPAGANSRPKLVVVSGDLADESIFRSQLAMSRPYPIDAGRSQAVPPLTRRTGTDARCRSPALIKYSRPMSKVFVTGMSGTGKSSGLRALATRGHRTIDTDTDEWSHWVTLPDGSLDWIWREDEMTGLLRGHGDGSLFVAGCKTNQGRFYKEFDHVALLSAPIDLLFMRIDGRSDNPYGKSAAEREMIIRHVAEVEPRLRASATVEIDASAPLEDVVVQLERLG